jgi:hypothetical protein
MHNFNQENFGSLIFLQVLGIHLCAGLIHVFRIPI